MALAIFDLDNTLIAGDSDHAWGEFIVGKGIVDSAHYKQKNDYFYRQYQAGKLDIQEYLAFALEPLSRLDTETLQSLHREFMTQYIKPMLLQRSRELLASHRKQGDTLLIITSTNSFVAGPICELHQVDDYLTSDAEFVGGRYTGKSIGTPCYREGKITRLQQWLADKQMSLEGSYGYSDSINDLPLLEAVDTPVVVDGDEELTQHANTKGWPCISLRD